MPPMRVLGLMPILLLAGLVQIPAQTQSPSDQGKKEGVFRVGGGVRAPEIILSSKPESGPACKPGRKGKCVLQLVVGKDGEPRDIKVVRPLGMGLDEKAIEAVQKWKFSPALKDGLPVAVQINIEIALRLYDSPDGKFLESVKAADAGDAKAQFEVSTILLAGCDQPQDEPRGLAYLEKSARQGLPEAQFSMGDYLSSHGTDLVSAYVWYYQAQRNHYEPAGKSLKDLEEKMTPEQLSEGRKRAETNTRF